MARRTTVNDFQNALETVDKLCEKYSHKDVGSQPKWETQSSLTHLQHAKGHIDTLILALREIPIQSLDYEDFASAVFRTLAALEKAVFAKRTAERLGETDGQFLFKVLTTDTKPAPKTECQSE